MDIQKLPSPGPSFSFVDPLSGFKRKLSVITIASEYKNLHKDVDLIIDAIKPYYEEIKRGGIERDDRFRIWEKIKAADKSLTHWDMELVMDILEHLSQ
jgi:hypothetical protein